MTGLSVWRDLLNTGRAYSRGLYPPFTYHGTLPRHYVPAFVYHAIGRQEFETHLRHLERNGYVGVSCDEATTLMRGGQDHERRSVLITFDDGLANLYSVVFPLLARYRQRAVAYVAPAWVGQPGFVTWDQCREMHRSGLVDFQSHSLRHFQAVTDLTVAGVWVRSSDQSLLWDVPGYEARYANTQPRKLPLLPGRSVFNPEDGYLLPESFWRECVAVQCSASATGAPRSLTNRGFKRLCQAALDGHADSVVRLSRQELLDVAAEELRASRHSLEQELRGHAVKHFAFPWLQHSVASWQLLRQAGFLSGAVGLELREPPLSDSGPPVLSILRVNGDFVMCLPGAGRRRFLSVIRHKAFRRLSGVPAEYGGA